MDVFLQTERLRLRRFTAADVENLVALDAEELLGGGFLGWLSLQPPPDGGTAELDLGYRLRRSAWGRGYATEGARALVRTAFGVLGAQRVFAQTMAVNLRSRRVMEKAGLRYLRTFHLEWDDPIPGTEHGEVEYELRRAHRLAPGARG
jgi:RimJ/RimL family protein N-acetyltransferase